MFFWYISFPALVTSFLRSFICFSIFLTLLFSLIFFSFLSGLLISSLISTSPAMASVISGKEFLSFRWFSMTLLALCSTYSLSFTFISLSLSSTSYFVVVITLSICIWNSFLRSSSSSFTSVFSSAVCPFSYII